MRAPLFSLALVCPVAALAQDIALAFPVDCILGETCYIQQFLDHDPGPGHSDFACGTLSYDGHTGTDIALPSLAAVDAGVTVLAAADGVVTGVRDGMADVLQGTAEAPDVSDRQCGNGVVIAHPGGWDTQYCHLKQGSVTVSTGDRVTAGTPLAQIGLSGDTQFPHLHLSLRKDGADVDPFDPDGQITCGTDDPDDLWLDRPATPPGGLISAGFAADIPDLDGIRAGTAAANTLPRTAPALVLWGYVFGGRDGDQIVLQIDGPDGTVFDHTVNLNRTQAQLFRAGGRRTPDGGWPAGTYEGLVSHVRAGEVIDRTRVAIALTP